VGGEELRADIVISNADIHHTEQNLLEAPYRTYSPRYWQSRTVGPSALVMYLGIKGELPSLVHHNLLFSKDWPKNFADIFAKNGRNKAKWPTDPSLYVCNPSKTDPSVAPKGYENLFVLVPIAAGLEYTDAELEAFGDHILETIEKELRLPGLRDIIVYRRSFSVKDFAQQYNSYRGSALGLSHTLKQTAIWRPSNISKKVAGLYYVGSGTTPGIGLPTCLVSAELVYKRLTGDHSPGSLTHL
jgi:phytoene desaturase